MSKQHMFFSSTPRTFVKSGHVYPQSKRQKLQSLVSHCPWQFCFADFHRYWMSDLKPLLLREMQGRFLQTSGYIFVNWSTLNLVWCVVVCSMCYYLVMLSAHPAACAWGTRVSQESCPQDTSQPSWAQDAARQHQAWGPFWTVKSPTKGTKCKHPGT